MNLEAFLLALLIDGWKRVKDDNPWHLWDSKYRKNQLCIGLTEYIADGADLNITNIVMRVCIYTPKGSRIKFPERNFKAKIDYQLIFNAVLQAQVEAYD